MLGMKALALQAFPWQRLDAAVFDEYEFHDRFLADLAGNAYTCSVMLGIITSIFIAAEWHEPNERSHDSDERSHDSNVLDALQNLGGGGEDSHDLEALKTLRGGGEDKQSADESAEASGSLDDAVINDATG